MHSSPLKNNPQFSNLLFEINGKSGFYNLNPLYMRIWFFVIYSLLASKTHIWIRPKGSREGIIACVAGPDLTLQTAVSSAEPQSRWWETVW